MLCSVVPLSAHFDSSTNTYTAILGPSGSGKSTLLSLLMGFYKCNGGRLLWDGDDVATTMSSYRTVRSALSVVFQETMVLDGTIYENIAFGTKDEKSGADLSLTQIIKAAKAAEAHDFINQLPNKYDTILGKSATVNLSGGQLQRICGIARALARGGGGGGGQLLLLDEFTSALDAVTEESLIRVVERLRDEEGMTIISVTHRPNTAIQADNIIVLDHGLVAQMGTYHELLQEEGIFRNLVEASSTTNKA